VIRTALGRAGVEAAAVGYVEGHGTGTPLGDPQEAGALATVFGGNRGEDAALVVGAAKSNVGHLEFAAGMVGLVKAVLCLRHGEVPPNLHCATLNPRLEDALRRCPMAFPMAEHTSAWLWYHRTGQMAQIFIFPIFSPRFNTCWLQ